MSHLIIVRKMEQLLSIAYICWPVSACQWSCSCPPFSKFTKLRYVVLLQLWFSSLGYHQQAKCLLLMFTFGPKRFLHLPALDTFLYCYLCIFPSKNSWHNWFYVTKEAVRCLGKESEFPHLMVFTWWQVINNRDTLVELLAKHTGNVHISLLSTFHKL
jgi:hypothetical protein